MWYTVPLLRDQIWALILRWVVRKTLVCFFDATQSFIHYVMIILLFLQFTGVVISVVPITMMLSVIINENYLCFISQKISVGKNSKMKINWDKKLHWWLTATVSQEIKRKLLRRCPIKNKGYLQIWPFPNIELSWKLQPYNLVKSGI